MVERSPTEMEKKVAKAIFDGWPHMIVGLTRRKWEDIGPNDKDATWFPLARAAIRAMREPTKEMMSPQVHGELWSGDMASFWQAMTDAASPSE